MPSFEDIYNTTGVKYIKISKISANGLDRTAYLEQLTAINVNFNDVGVVEYRIVSSQQFEDYYMFGVNLDPSLSNQYGTPQYPVSSSTGNEIKDYRLDARKNYSSPHLISSSISLFPPQPLEVSSIIGYTSTPIDVLNYFTPSTGKYLYNNTPNLNNSQFYCSASFWIEGNGANGTYVNVNSFVLLEREGTILGTVTPVSQTLVNFADINGGDELQIFMNSPLDLGVVDNFLEGDSLVLAICTTQPLALAGGSDVSLIKQLKFELSQSVNPNTSYQTTTFNPDEINFYYSDYNALYGNAELPKYSQYKMEADYSNQLKPVNFNQLLEGTAIRAKVQDSNYSSKAWTTVRYEGSKYISQQSTLNNGFNANAEVSLPNSLDTGYGNLPAAEQNETFFAYFDSVTTSTPEIIGQTSYTVRYIIDDDGNVANPQSFIDPNTQTETNIGLINLKDTFEPGKNATISPLSPPTVSPVTLAGTFPITHVGIPTSIFVTETGSRKLDYTPIASFTLTSGLNFGEVINNYQFRAVKPYSQPQIYNDTSFHNVTFTSATQPNPTHYNPSPSVSRFTTANTSTAEAGTPIKFRSSIVFKHRIIHTRQLVQGQWEPYSLGGSGAGDYQNTAPFIIQIKNFTTLQRYKRLELDLRDVIDRTPQTVYNIPDTILDGVPTGGTYKLIQWVYDGNAPGAGNGYFWVTIEASLSTSFLSLDINNLVGIEVQSKDTGNIHEYEIFGNSNTSFQCIQQYPINEYGVDFVTASYWEGTGSIPPIGIPDYEISNQTSVLTSSIGLATLYAGGLNDNLDGSRIRQSLDEKSILFGYTNNVLPFYIQPGDFIRLEHNPEYVYNIKKVTLEDRLYLTVWPPITPGTTIDHFNIYRIIDDGATVIINTPIPISGSTFTGTMFPQFINKTLFQSSSIIIQTLIEKGIIS